MLRRRGRAVAGRATSLALRIGVILLTVSVGCDATTEGRPHHEASREAEREMVAPGWDTLFTVGGSLEDTLLLSPDQLDAGPRGVGVADSDAGRILLFDHEGRLEWVVGREGGGPSEFRNVRDLEFGRSGSLWVLDAPNNRLTRISPSGSVGLRVPLHDLESVPEQILYVRDGPRITLFTMDRQEPLVTVDGSGRVLETRPFPWDGFSELPTLVTQVVSDWRSGQEWTAMALFHGNGFFVRREDEVWESHVGGFVEHVPFPEVERETNELGGGRVRRSTRVASPLFAALDVAASSRSVLALFSGGDELRSRLLDVYDRNDGSYRKTLRLPRTLSDVAVHDGVVYGLFEDPVPVLAAYRPRRGEIGDHGRRGGDDP